VAPQTLILAPFWCKKWFECGLKCGEHRFFFLRKTLGYVYHCMIEMVWQNAIGEKLSKLRQVALLVVGAFQPHL
jgi:hypothetical protein